jgi:hypothetical protein
METDSTNRIEQCGREEDRPEPFASVLELVSEHGNRAVIEALADNAGFDAAEPDAFLAYRREQEWLQLEFTQLLERHELLFPEPETQVNHEGPVLVQ